MGSPGKQLKKLRIYFGLTQEEFAKTISVKRNNISMIESERNRPTFDLIADVCGVFNLPADYFLSEDNPESFSEYFDDIKIRRKDILNNNNPGLNFRVQVKIGSEAEFINEAHEYIRKINYLYQRLIDIRTLLFQELKLKGTFSTKAETDLLNELAKPQVKDLDNETSLHYPYENLSNKEKDEYMQKLDACLNLFTNTFFECFEQLYNGIRIPVDKQLRASFFADREKLTDNFKYIHYIKSYS